MIRGTASIRRILLLLSGLVITGVILSIINDWNRTKAVSEENFVYYLEKKRELLG